MAAKQYRVLVLSWINDRLVQEGEIISYDGKPGSNLEEIKEPKGSKTSDSLSPSDSDDSPL